MADHKSRWISRQVRFVCRQAHGQNALPFQDVLNSQMVDQVIRNCGVTCRDCLYTPAVTIWTFLAQVLSADHSCRVAVMRLRTHLLSIHRTPCSADTSPCCKARQRLPEELPMNLARRVGAELHQDAGRDPSFLSGRPMKMVDGATVSMPDTPANQAAYPQPSTQPQGIGFPLARLVVILSWHVGVVLDMAIGPYAGKATGETALLRQLLNQLKTNDILLADRYFGNWWTIAMLQRRGVDIICPLHQLRSCDFRRGHRLGFEDHIVTWPKLPRPNWMTLEFWESLPDELVIRELRVHSQDRTTRATSITLVTTLVDPMMYPKSQINDGYHWRWDSELDLRSIKTVMQMDVLRCKTPDMVRKEIGMHVLACNLIRTVMAESAAEYDLEPRAISFKGAMQGLNAFRATAVLAPTEELPFLYDNLLAMLSQYPVRNRSGRVEPRAVKRRPKSHKLLTVPRHIARRRCPET